MIVGRMRRAWVVGFSLLAVACTGGEAGLAPADSIALQGSTESAPGTSESTSVPNSVLELLPDQERANFVANERYLASLVVPPSAVSDDLRIEYLSVRDPSGDLRIGDGWYEPFIEEFECSSRVDLPPMPFVTVDYHFGDPSQSTATGLPGGGPNGERWFSVSVSLFDTAQQRELALELLTEQAKAEPRCLGTAQENVLLLHDPIEVGYPGDGFLAESFFDGVLSARADWFDYEVGERVLVSISDSDLVPAPDVDRQLLDALAQAQIEHLKDAGLG